MNGSFDFLKCGKVWPAVLAIAGLCLAGGLFAMAIAGWYYDSKLEAIQKAHRQEMAVIERRHTRDRKTVRGEVIERLDRIERLTITRGKE